MHATPQSAAVRGVEIRNLALERGGWRLFEGLDLSASPGEYIALVGPNGSGKTSLLRALAGLLQPASGQIRIDGETPEDGGVNLHFMGHRDGLKATLSAIAHVRFWKDLLQGAGTPEEALAQVGLSRVADLPTRVLSAGQSRRLALTRLLVAPRPVWLLDEPAAALDTQGKALLTRLIEDHTHAGGLVFAAVHEPLGAPTRALDVSAFAPKAHA